MSNAPFITNMHDFTNELLKTGHEHRIGVMIQAGQLDDFVRNVYDKYDVTKLTISYQRNSDEYIVAVELWG